MKMKMIIISFKIILLFSFIENQSLAMIFINKKNNILDLIIFIYYFIIFNNEK
jgi:hypothetical protein